MKKILFIFMFLFVGVLIGLTSLFLNNKVLENTLESGVDLSEKHNLTMPITQTEFFNITGNRLTNHVLRYSSSESGIIGWSLYRTVNSDEMVQMNMGSRIGQTAYRQLNISSSNEAVATSKISFENPNGAMRIQFSESNQNRLIMSQNVSVIPGYHYKHTLQHITNGTPTTYRVQILGIRGSQTQEIYSVERTTQVTTTTVTESNLLIPEDISAVRVNIIFTGQGVNTTNYFEVNYSALGINIDQMITEFEKEIFDQSNTTRLKFHPGILVNNNFLNAVLNYGQILEDTRLNNLAYNLNKSNSQTKLNTYNNYLRDIRAHVLSLETSLTNLYTNASKQRLKPGTAQTDIDQFNQLVTDAKTKKLDDTSSDTTYRNYMLNYMNYFESEVTRLNTQLSLENRRAQTILNLNNLISAYLVNIAALPQMTAESLSNLEQAADIFRIEETQNINNVNIESDFEGVETTFRNRLNTNELNTTLLKYREDSVVKRDELLNSINTNDLLTSDEKQSFVKSVQSDYDEYITKINQTTSLTTANTNKTDYETRLEEIKTNANQIGTTNLSTSIQNAKQLLTTTSDAIKQQINALTGINTLAKSRYVDEVNSILNQAQNRLDQAKNNAEVTSIRTLEDPKFNEVLTRASFVDKKISTKTLIQTRLTEFRTLVNSKQALTETEKQTLINELLSDQALANEAVDNSTNETSITEALNDFITKKDTKSMQLNRQNETNRLNNRQTQINEEINSLNQTSQTIKNTATTDINNLKTNAINELTAANTPEDFLTISSNYINQMNQYITLLTEKNNAKDELYKKAGDNPNQEQQDILTRYSELIDNATNSNSINTQKTESLSQLDNNQKETIQNNIDNEVSNFIPGVISPEQQAIIDKNKALLENATTAEAAQNILEQLKTEILTLEVDNKNKELQAFVPEPRTPEQQTLLDGLTNELNEGRTLAEINQRSEKLKQDLLSLTRNQKMNEFKQFLIIERTQALQVIEDDLNADFNQVSTILDINSLYQEALQKAILQAKVDAKLRNNNLTNASDEQLDAILSNANLLIDNQTTLQGIINVETQTKTLIDNKLVELANVNNLKTYYEDLLASYSLNENQRQQLLTLYEENQRQLINETISLSQAMQSLATRATDFINIIYNVSTGNFNAFDANLRYPNNATNLVYASIANTSGLRLGTTLDISRHDISLNQSQVLQQKFSTGTLTAPSNLNITTEQLRSKLQAMEYIRRIDAQINYQDGTRITDFFGTYSLSLLIPDEYLNYSEFLVIFETTNGAEVLRTYKTNNWLTFETTHFSSFYVLGQENETTNPNPEPNPNPTPDPDNKDIKENRVGLIVSLVLAGLAVTSFITLLIVKFTKKNQMKTRSIAVIGLLGVTSIIQIVLIIIVGLIIILLVAYLLKFLLDKKTQKEVIYITKKEEVKPVITEKIIEKIYIVKEEVKPVEEKKKEVSKTKPKKKEVSNVIEEDD